MRTNVSLSASDKPQAAQALTVVPLRHPWRTAAVVVLMLAAVMLYMVATNPEFQWGTVCHYLFNPMILKGAGMTLVLMITVMFLSFIGGTVVALMLISPSNLLALPARLFVWFFRGTPALVQLIFWYIPVMTGPANSAHKSLLQRTMPRYPSQKI